MHTGVRLAPSMLIRATVRSITALNIVLLLVTFQILLFLQAISFPVAFLLTVSALILLDASRDTILPCKRFAKALTFLLMEGSICRGLRLRRCLCLVVGIGTAREFCMNRAGDLVEAKTLDVQQHRQRGKRIRKRSDEFRGFLGFRKLNVEHSELSNNFQKRCHMLIPIRIVLVNGSVQTMADILDRLCIRCSVDAF